jgi:dCTP deaminase
MTATPATRSGVLRYQELAVRLLSDGASRLVVSPILDSDQIGDASIDVRLGSSFLVVSRTRAQAFAVTRDRVEVPDSYYEAHMVGSNGSIVLHPGEFVLGSTLEYLSLPPDLMAYVIGKSTIGRLGLIIATATHVAPGYKGTLTLELTNVGTVPIRLEPGIQIAQLVFHDVTGAVPTPYSEHGRYQFSIGPEAPKSR